MSKFRIKLQRERLYNLSEEIIHSITHGIGALFSIAALVILIVIAVNKGDVWHVVSFSIFGTSLILLYFSSTLYHSLPPSRAKRWFQGLDHSAIYILIAGSYTPYALVGLQGGGWGWSLFGVVWGLTLFGIIIEWVMGKKWRTGAYILYLVMGWLCVLATHKLIEHISTTSFIFLVAGGLSYTFGFIFFAWDRLPFNHAIWHLFVLGGSFCHFFSILYLIN